MYSRTNCRRLTFETYITFGGNVSANWLINVLTAKTDRFFCLSLVRQIFFLRFPFISFTFIKKINLNISFRVDFI